MNLHLVEIAAAVTPGSHAVLMIDQAGWHMSTRLVVPHNITILPLPPRSPELNPVENIWQFMRDNWLSNRIFKSYEDLVDHCCYAWNSDRCVALVQQPDTIRDNTLFHWWPCQRAKKRSAGVGITPTRDQGAGRHENARRLSLPGTS